ncbi:MAG: PDZ domain-containing protein [Deltaproteobacteria bacterium]|nr:PDZ domain-containing protein [Deltaproteobacteria bacterium]
MKRWLVVVCTVALSRAAVADDDDALYKCHPTTGKVRAYFKPNTELKDLVTWIMGFSCKNIVLGANVDPSTKITLLVPGELTQKQALKLFADAVDAAGYSVLDKGDNLVIKAPPGAAKPCPSGAPTTPATASASPADADDLTALLDAGIKKIDDTHVEVSAKVIDAVLANPMGIAKGARIIPAMHDGKPEGFKIYAVRPSSLYARIGLVNGDTIASVNGYDMTSADKALEVYTKLRDAKKVELAIVRRAKPLTLTITIKP